jgi:hypothetical protein
MTLQTSAAVLVVALASMALAWIAPASAQTASADSAAGRADPSAYAQAPPQRVRPRIRVTPRCPYRTESVPYPVPYECDYPGPGFVRQCAARLVQEYRPSGTVIVPVTRCWWERG